MLASTPLSHRISFLALLAALVAALLLVSTAAAQDPTPATPVSDDQVNAVAKDLYCPVCENTPLDQCPTQACIQWRELIREKLGQGWSRDQIRDYFAAYYGDRVLSAPPFRGWYIAGYAVLALLLLLAVFVFYRVIMRLRRPAPAVAAPEKPAPPSDPYASRFEQIAEEDE